MNLADQIEAVARAATAEVAAASRAFSLTRRDLSDALRAHQASTPDAVARARADLEDDADAVDATPGILLPADRAETSPHLPGAEH